MFNYRGLFSALSVYLPLLAVVSVISVGLWVAYFVLLKRQTEMGPERRFPRQLLMLILAAVALFLVILAFPMSDATRSQVLSLLGIVLTGIIAISSTNFVANIMAGLMLRVVNSFRPGDFIHVKEKFGRVTERGLIHTEIQTEDRDLTTFPNLYLITNPVTVVRSSGTIVSATLSLGYDVSHRRVEELLKEAAGEVDLAEPFVQVKKLGDFSVTYRIAGFLTDVKRLLTVRSELRKKVMDVLHENGIEIVSPSFMNQRPLPDGKKFIPIEPEIRKAGEADKEEDPEAIIFDKAEQAEILEHLQEEAKQVKQKLGELNKIKKSAVEKERVNIEAEIHILAKRAKEIEDELSRIQERIDKSE